MNPPALVKRVVSLGLLLAVACSPLLAQAFSARVIGISDGDTITVLRERGQVKVRLEGIDAPERGQDFGSRARQKLSDLAFGRDVTVEVRDHDRWGRAVARVYAGGVDVSEAMVAAGLAWHFKRYSSDPTLARLEREARAARRGLWSVVNPQPPWEFRSAQASDSFGGIGSDRGSSSAAPLTSSAYHGNRSSKVFHRPGCQHYYCKNCTAVFASRAAAIAAGYRPGQCCKP